MKIKLLIVSILLTIILTGCNAKYSLTIEDGKIKENLTIIEDNKEKVDVKDDLGKSFYDYAKLYGEEQNTSVDYNALYSLTSCTNNCIYYDKEFINDEDSVGFILNHEFEFDEFTFSSIANEFIPTFSVLYDGRYLQISGKEPLNYYKDYELLEDLAFSISTKYKVTSTNLKNISNGVYQWKPSEKAKDNANNLYITLDTKEEIATECTGSGAATMLNKIDNVIKEISNRTTTLGAAQNRIDSAIESIAVQSENITSSLSTLRDADVAKESSNYIQAQILQQAAATLLATANQTPSIALNLL